MSQWEMILLAVGFAFGMGFGGIACAITQILDNEAKAKAELKRRKEERYGHSV